MIVSPDEGAALTLADETGRVVAEIGSFVTMPISREQLRSGLTTPRHESLFHLAWESHAPGAGAQPPRLAHLVTDDDLGGLEGADFVVARVPQGGDGHATVAHLHTTEYFG